MSLAADLDDLGRSFARYLRAANRSEKTVATYGEAVTQLTDYVTGLDHPPDEVGDIERQHVEGCLVDLGKRGRRPCGTRASP